MSLSRTTWLYLLIIVGVNGHVNKFKSCSSSGFCKRQKASDSKNGYYLHSNSVIIKNDAFEAVMLNKANPNDNSLKLKLSIARVINNVLRLFVSELHPIRPRFQLDDIINEKARKFLPFTNINLLDNECTLSWNDKYSVNIEYNPLKATITKNGKKEMIINEFDTFYFEVYTNRSDDNEDEDAAKWEETFSSHSYFYDNGAASIGLDFTFINTKFLYGIPEHATSLPLKNTDDYYSEPYRLWNLDVFEYKLDVTDALYGAIPYILGYNAVNANAVLWMNAAETYIDVIDSNEEKGKNIKWMSESGAMEAFILLYDNNIKQDKSYLYQYYEITGKPQLPPLFAIGHHQCRWNYNDVDEVREISDKLDELDIPTDVIWLDIEHTDGKRYFTWNKYNFADPINMIDYVSSSGRKMVTIVDPHIKVDDSYDVYNDINELDLWVKTRDGDVYKGWCWPGHSMYPDFINPQMRRVWSEQFKFDKYDGSTPDLFIWNDMNEPSAFDGPEVSMPISNIHKYNNTEVRHNEVHNIYGYFVHEATFNGLLLRSDYKQRPFVLSRSFFCGSQKYGAVWTGDNTANWDHLKMSVPMLLSLSIAGLPFVGADIGGFFNNPDGELMARWYELGAYYPFFRNHAHQDTQRRELWQFDAQYAQRMKYAILGRYRILPYIYTLFYLNKLIMRPLWYGNFRNDETTYNREDAFMFGEAFYIHPIVEKGITEIDINLPQNIDNNAIYYEMNGDTLNIYGSGSHHLVGYSSRIPVLRYGGTITVEKHRIRRSGSLMKYDPVTIIIALDANNNAMGSHYIDDEESLNNEYILTTLKYDGKQNKLSNLIENQSDSMNSVPQLEIERIVIMAKDIHQTKINEIHIKQLTNSRRSKKFGVTQDTLAIRKPQILVNYPFTLQLSI